MVGQRFTVGKLDAGIAVLLSDSVLIEFPSLLLPPDTAPGSIVTISCTRDTAAEQAAQDAFWQLQEHIYNTYGTAEPVAPVLKVRNVTQTSVTLEWDKLELASAKLLGLSIWRNGGRLTSIPNPTTNTSTKLSGLELDTDYQFHLVLKTTAGTFNSPIVKVRTHTISDTSGISACFGLVEPPEMLESAQAAVASMKARSSSTIQIETTHFVATSHADPSAPDAGPGVEYQKALRLSIPVVTPEWVLACEREKKMVPIANYYLGTHSANPSGSPSATYLPQSPPTQSIPSLSEAAASIPAAAPASKRAVLAEEAPEGPPADNGTAGWTAVPPTPPPVEAPVVVVAAAAEPPEIVKATPSPTIPQITIAPPVEAEPVPAAIPTITLNDDEGEHDTSEEQPPPEQEVTSGQEADIEEAADEEDDEEPVVVPVTIAVDPPVNEGEAPDSEAEEEGTMEDIKLG